MKKDVVRKIGPVTIRLVVRTYGHLYSWCFRIVWRKGAGYKGGRTFYVGWRCHDMRGAVGNGVYHSYHTPRTFTMGLTTNANIVPIPMNF